MPYYYHFVETYPDVFTLADAPEEQILRSWQGLGYYSRARNLHAAARQITRDHGGSFPESPEKLRGIKGIGEYTAAAIASFAFGEPVPVVDGNVIRVLSRYLGIHEHSGTATGKRKLAEAARELLYRPDPATYNQAIMEFGALQCVPVSPDCQSCPLAGSCFAFREKKVDLLPARKPKKLSRTRIFRYYFIHDGEFVLVRKRTGRDIWKGLYELVLREEDEVAPEGNFKELGRQKHVLSHQVLQSVFYVSLDGKIIPEQEYERVLISDLHRLAFPRLITRWMESPGFRELGLAGSSGNQ